MKFIPFLLVLFSAVAEAQDKLEWLEDLPSACEKAKREGKIILCRQALCDCSEKTCHLRYRASHPLFLKNEAVRTAVSRNCILLVLHAPSRKSSEQFADPGLTGDLPAAKRASVPIFLLTPTRQILNRPELCPCGSDFEREIEFTLRIRDECFDSQGVPRRGGLIRVFQLLHDHWNDSKACHGNKTGELREGSYRTRDCTCKLPDVGESGSNTPWPPYDIDVRWHTGLPHAEGLAAEADRLVLYFQIVGDLDKEGC